MTDEQADFNEFEDEPKALSERTITIGHVNEPHDTYGGRHRGSGIDENNPPHRGWLGNPYPVEEHGREQCIEMFEGDFIEKALDDHLFCNALLGLPGQVVACYCRHTDEQEPACHLDVVRDRLKDGLVFRAAIRHDIPLPEWMEDRAMEKSEVLNLV